MRAAGERSGLVGWWEWSPDGATWIRAPDLLVPRSCPEFHGCELVSANQAIVTFLHQVCPAPAACSACRGGRDRGVNMVIAPELSVDDMSEEEVAAAKEWLRAPLAQQGVDVSWLSDRELRELAVRTLGGGGDDGDAAAGEGGGDDGLNAVAWMAAAGGIVAAHDEEEMTLAPFES